MEWRTTGEAQLTYVRRTYVGPYCTVLTRSFGSHRSSCESKVATYDSKLSSTPLHQATAELQELIVPSGHRFNCVFGKFIDKIKVQLWSSILRTKQDLLWAHWHSLVKWHENSCVKSHGLTSGDMSSDGPQNSNVTAMSHVVEFCLHAASTHLKSTRTSTGHASTVPLLQLFH